MSSDIIGSEMLLALNLFLFEVLVFFLLSVLDRCDYFAVVCFSSSLSKVEVSLFF